MEQNTIAMFDVGWEIGKKSKKYFLCLFVEIVTEGWYLIICIDKVVTKSCFR